MCSHALLGQCDFDNSIEIADESTITLDFTVSGADNDTLGVNNCLKIVTTYFDHGFVSDLTIELESPSGQIVELIGAEVDGTSTSLVNAWNVQFYNRDELMAEPDLDYGDIWNSNPNGGWVIFTTYTGAYYPYQDGLEDFTGNVNGVWKLHITDESLFGVGNFNCFGLEFCSDDGITVGTCSPVTHSIVETDVALCEGDPALDLSISPMLSEVYDSITYDYQYLFFSGGLYQSLTSNTDFSGRAPGNYTLCGIQYLKDDFPIIEEIAVGSVLADIDAYIIDSEICASLSGDCIDIEVFSIPDVITDQRTICKGDTVFIGSDIYTEPGTYDITTNIAPCDSMSIMELEVIDVEVSFFADALALSCDKDTIRLDGTATNVPVGATDVWITTGGNYIGPPNDQIIELDAAGIYSYIVNQDGCQFSQEIEIIENDDFLEFNIVVGDITCTSDSALVDLTSSDIIEDIDWTGTGGFRKIDEDILVGEAGTYRVDFVTEFGCFRSMVIEVEDVRVLPDFELNADTLTCLSPTTIITTTPSDNLNSSFFWIRDDVVVGMNKSLTTDIPGKYDLRVRTGEGCLDSFDIEIISTIDTLDVELLAGEFGCETLEVEIGYSSSFGGLDPLWTLPDGAPVVDSSFFSVQSGEYSLHLENDKSCTLDTTLFVAPPQDNPEIEVQPISFLCGQDSVQVLSTVNMPGVNYEWSNQNGYRDTTEMPWILAPGEYMVEVCIDNGCCSRDTFDVGIDTDLPQVSFDFGNIDCENDIVFITPSDTSTYDMDWFLNDAPLAVDSNIIRVINPGFYEVVVTNPANGCSNTYSFDIMEDKVDTIENISAQILNCEKEEIQIQLTAERAFESYLWIGPGLLDLTEEPLVNLPGRYVIEYTFANGCTGRDSIEVIDEGELPNLMGRDTVYNCFSSTLDLSVSYTSSTINIQWEGPNFQDEGEDVTISEPGIYNIYAVAPGLCRDTIQIEVVADTISPTISLVNDGIITCADTIVDITLTVDGSTTSYTFDGPSIVTQDELVIEVDRGGIYTATGMADNGCVTTVSNEVLVSNDFPEYEILLDSITCVVDQVNVGIISPDPALDIVWQGPISIPNGNYTFNTSTAGSYSFILTNADGCRSIDSFFILRDSFPPTGSIALSNQLTCDLTEATLSVLDYEADWSLQWSGGGVSDPSATTVTTDVIGEYQVQITAANGCITFDTMTIEYDTIPAAIELFGDAITCTSGKVFLNVVSDKPLISYDWQGPSGYTSADIEPLVFESGMYTVTVTSENGCISSGEFEVIDEREFPIIEVDDYFLPCDGAPAVVTTAFISSGASPRWFGPDNFFVDADTANIFLPGEYIGIALTAEGCSITDTFQVIDEPVLPVFSADADILLCFGPVEIRAIDIEDDRSVSWSGPGAFSSDTSVSLVSEPGIYTLTVIGDNGCVDSTSIVVMDGRIFPDAVADITDLFQCQNTEVNLSGIGTSEGSIFTYQWTTSDGVILENETGLNPRIEGEGTYIIEVTNNEIGCISYDTLVLTLQEQELMAVDLNIIPPTCMDFENGVIEINEVIGGYGPYQVSLDGFDYGTRMDIQYLDVGDHELTIVDSLGCVLDSLVVIDTSNLLSVILPIDTTLIFGQSINVLADINLSLDSIQSILWSSNVPCDGCTSFDLIPDGNMTISVTVVDINGCEVEEEFRLTVNRPENLPFPQIFSPNGDGMNDVFYLPLVTGIESIDFIRVYDNWGGLLHEATNPTLGDPSFGWDGTVSGVSAEMAVYIVEAIVTLVDGKKVRYTGDVTLVR